MIQLKNCIVYSLILISHILAMYSQIVQKAYNYVKSLLKKYKINEDNWYYFHNWKHIKSVFERASYLAKKEWLDEEMQEIIQLAALFHDVGFIKQYDNNEEIWAQIAEDWLKSQNFPEDKIEIVKRLILATVPTFVPDLLPCKIIKDADLDNLGTPDAILFTKMLAKELKHVKWLDVSTKDLLSKDFILNYKPYTSTQLKERKEQLAKNKLEIKKYITTK